MEVCIFDQLMLVKNMGGKEKDALRLLLKERKSILDSMFLETQAELEQLSKVNDSLYDLTQKLNSKTYSLYVALLKTGFDPEFDDDIMLDGTLRFLSDLNEDDDSVLAMEEDDLYGFDFRWMLGPASESVPSGHHPLPGRLRVLSWKCFPLVLPPPAPFPASPFSSRQAHRKISAVP